MNVEEAIAYIHSHEWRAHAPELGRIRELMRQLGNPQKELKFIHVAGTNGKGSTCAMLSAILQAAGFRVGLNISPYIQVFQERIQINGQLIPDETLAALVERVRPIADAMPEPPSEFELITAVAFLYFYQEHCDIVVLEVGLGGALDASNIIDTPEAAVITAMGIDHLRELGPTLTDIARAKAGIIKPGGQVVSYGGVPEADRVFRAASAQQGASLHEVDFSRLRRQQFSLDGTTFSFLPYQELHMPLLGPYQTRNAALVLTVVETLRQNGWTISDDAVRIGLASAAWSGRMQLLSRSPVLLLDGAHNAHGMRASVSALSTLMPGKKWIFVMGILAEKDIWEMFDALAPLAERVYTVRPDSPRALGAEALADKLHQRGVPAEARDSVESALSAAREAAGSTGAICACGSLYLCGAVLEAAGHGIDTRAEL